VRESEVNTDMTRANWEEIHQSNVGHDCGWHLEGLPDQTVALLETPRVIKDRALDLGCGAGHHSILLGQFFSTVVGVDFAESGVRRAVAAVGSGNPAPHFFVGDATALPFPDDSFDFILDRGCLLTIPVDQWPDYFRNIERVMKTGAYYQVFYRKGGWPDRPYRHWQRPGRGRRSALRRFLSKARRLTMSRPHPPPQKLDCFPPTFECETTESVPFISASGAQVEYTHIICRKT